MPRAPNERPSRRLDAILETLRKHGVRRFEAGKLEGIGEGLKWTFEAPQPQRSGRPAPARAAEPGDPDLELPEEPDPIDELALVARGLEGPVPENGVS